MEMNDRQMAELKKWFDDYVKGFYGIDSVVDSNVALKEQHTRQTCAEVRHLACALDLRPDQRLLAETVALFHDLGRFEQFRDYRTFVDAVSINHARHSAWLLEKLSVLAGLRADERMTVKQAILLHNAKALPANLSAEVMLYSRIIRDADKLDIYRVFHEYYDQLRNDPESLKANLDLPVSDEFTPSILQALLERRPVDYSELRTSTDVTLLHLAWVYDMNFVASLRRVRDEGHLAELVSHLPAHPDIRSATEMVLAYIEEKTASGAVLASEC
jgi:HD superfamily phosphodiesterase